jgi:hypothetical protein
MLEWVEIPSDDSKEESFEDKSGKLDRLPSEFLDEDHGEIISREITGCGDLWVMESCILMSMMDKWEWVSYNQVGLSILPKISPWIFRFGQTDGGNDDRLIQVDTIKRDIEEKPSWSSSDERLEMSPFWKVFHLRPKTNQQSRRRKSNSDTHKLSECPFLAGHYICDPMTFSVFLQIIFLMNLSQQIRVVSYRLDVPELGGFLESQPLIESAQTRDQDQADDDPPSSVQIGIVVISVKDLLPDSQYDQGYDGTYEITLWFWGEYEDWTGSRFTNPSLHGEDEAEHDPSSS